MKCLSRCNQLSNIQFHFIALRNLRTYELLKVFRLLVDHGADVNLPCGLTDADISSVDGARCIGSGALNEACRIGCISLVQLLFQRGAVDHENAALATAFKV